MQPVAAPEVAIDVCGTGGDGKHTLNISTAVAIVVAACGVPVAKHGNRAASSKAGGADTLEALKLNLENASLRATDTLDDMGIAFLFAQKYHPALAWLAPIRKEIGKPTVLNYIGPLCNPARVKRQLIGVPNRHVLNIFKTIPWDFLGMERVMVVCGAEGLDEISISGPSDVFTFGFAMPGAITPADAGLPTHPLSAIKGGDAAYNAAALRKLLESAPDQNLAYRDAVLINAAAALIVAGEVNDWKSGVEEAREAIDKGLAKALLDCWIQFCE
jgi:anthranilate phosphoribosyltransferase